MFGYAKEHEPCIIFMDEIDAIGGRRFSEGTSADREIQRTLMELLNQLDGFDYLGKTKIIMATNRPDTLDPALLRAGRLDRKIEISLPNEVGRLEVLKIHAASVVTEGDLDFESVVKMSDGLNGADLRNVVTEAGLFAIKDYRDAVNQDDFNKAVRKVAESKKLEGKLVRQSLERVAVVAMHDLGQELCMSGKLDKQHLVALISNPLFLLLEISMIWVLTFESCRSTRSCNQGLRRRASLGGWDSEARRNWLRLDESRMVHWMWDGG